MITDPTVMHLCVERARLLKEYAHVLTRVGASHPRRSAMNKMRALKRKGLRAHIRRNADTLSSRCMQLMELL